MRIVRLLALTAATWATVLCLYVIAKRFTYPYELEWMTGSILDHVDRVKQGQPIYARPSIDWVPFLYPPLHYWLASFATEFWAGFQGCRALSIVASLIQAVCVHRIAARNGAGKLWSAIGVGLFFACFGYVGYWYDVERADSLFVAMMLGGTLLLMDAKSLLKVAAAGLLMGAGFFAKQPALLFLVAGAAALLLLRQWRQALVFGAVSGALILLGVLWLDRSTSGWFSYYVFKVPASHGIYLPRMWKATNDLGRAFTLAMGTVAVVVLVCRQILRRDDTERPRRETVIFAATLGASFFASVSSRLHPGGWVNVWMFWSSFSCAAVAVAGSWCERWAASSLAAGIPYVLVISQILTFSFNPNEQIPAVADSWFKFQEKTRQLERENGEVLVVAHGHVSSCSHAHLMAIEDLVRLEKGIPPQILAAFDEQRFKAVIVDEAVLTIESYGRPQDPHERRTAFSKHLFDNYYVSERMFDDQSFVPVGAATAPTFVLLPRKQRLGAQQGADARRQLLLEIGLATLDENARATGLKQRGQTTEERARELVERSVGRTP